MAPFDHATVLETWLEACAAGDATALRRLYDREAGFLLAVALRIVRRPEAAADVVHDAFLDIWARAGSFDPRRGEARAWITAIVRHRALKHLRRAGRETDLDPTLGAGIPDEAPDPFARLAATQEGARLHACLAQLAPERRRAILMAYRDGLSQAEIAGRLGQPLGTVKAWIRRSLVTLKGCLS